MSYGITYWTGYDAAEDAEKFSLHIEQPFLDAIAHDPGMIAFEVQDFMNRILETVAKTGDALPGMDEKVVAALMDALLKRQMGEKVERAGRPWAKLIDMLWGR